jgi:hypothetical protein
LKAPNAAFDRFSGNRYQPNEQVSEIFKTVCRGFQKTLYVAIEGFLKPSVVVLAASTLFFN